MFVRRVAATSVLLLLLLAGCAQPTEPCPQHPRADLSRMAAYAEDSELPFQFPLDEVGGRSTSYANFCAGSGPESTRKYHAAEDYHLPPGAPVYALADGEISFSGPMGGYGWLIIIDHPQANLYSLYGHLSPSRWRMEPGPVKKGDLIAYLGDNDENGGSSEQPLRPHLHLGVRAGQRADYPGAGEWRWMAGWIKPCPAGLGWMQPSAVITNQAIPAGGFSSPASSFIARWGVDLLLTGIYLFGGACMLIYARKRDKPFALIIAGAFLLVAGWLFYGKGIKTSVVLFVMAILFLALGISMLIGRSKKAPPSQT